MKEHSPSSTLAGEAYGIIRQRILRGEVAIGQVISRRKVAVELGMSLPAGIGGLLAPGV
jgi:DNA-binding GntR family transcriptional regulator